MKFDIEKLKQIARPMTETERKEIEQREENRDWQTLSAKFALSLRHILRCERISQTELAKRMKVSSVQVSKILSGKENIGLQTIAKVEKALGRSLIFFQDSTYNSKDDTTKKEIACAFSYPLNVEPDYYALSCGEPEG